MKKRLSRLTALFLSMVLAFPLALPALAFEDTDPPLWQQWDCSSLEEFLEQYDYSEEEYYRMAASVLENQARTQAWIDAHPEEYAAFDPEEYFSKAYPFYDSIEEYMVEGELTREEFEEDMRDQWVQVQINAEQQEQELARFKAEYPEECAAFDPYAYFAEEYYYYGSPQEYMELYELTEEEFRDKLFREWVWDFQQIVSHKTAHGGSARGINVMVDGQCVQFPDARPEVVSGRTMVPLRSIMEHLGAQVSYDQAANSAQVSMDGLSFTHVIGSDVLTLSDGSTVKMDVPSYIRDGRTMVPVRFFSETLGYEVLWDQKYQTAVLLDLQSLKERIDQEFTLLNRVLYAASGAGLVKEGQSTEQTVACDLDLTLFDTLHGDKRIPVKLSGSLLANDKAIELHFSGDLSGLADFLESSEYLYLDSQVISQLRPALADFSADIILNLELGAVYFRCPALAGLELDMDDPDAWIALPSDFSDLPLDSLTGASSVSELILAGAESYSGDLIDMGSPFWYWTKAEDAAGELGEYMSDKMFTRSGGSYTLSHEITDYSWSGEQTYTLKVSVTPSGEKSCTYSLSFGLTGDDMAADAGLKGSSGRTDLDLSLHLKNTFKLTLEGASRLSGSDRAPLSQPPAGSKIEFPAGPLGSGDL